MRHRSVKNTFEVGQLVKMYPDHDGKIIAVWGDVLKVEFSSGPRAGMPPLVDHFSKFKPA